MSHRTAHYTVYVDGTHYAIYEWTTRAQMVIDIRDILFDLKMPASAFRQADIRSRWARIAKHGSSVQHFVIEAAGKRISFDGMTVGEYNTATAD